MASRPISLSELAVPPAGLSGLRGAPAAAEGRGNGVPPPGEFGSEAGGGGADELSRLLSLAVELCGAVAPKQQEGGSATCKLELRMGECECL